MSLVAGKSLRGSASESTVAVFNAVGSVANGVATVVNAAVKGADMLDMYMDTTITNYRRTCALEVTAHHDRILTEYVEAELNRLEASAKLANLPFDRIATGVIVSEKYTKALEGL